MRPFPRIALEQNGIAIKAANMTARSITHLPTLIGRLYLNFPYYRLQPFSKFDPLFPMMILKHERNNDAFLFKIIRKLTIYEPFFNLSPDYKDQSAQSKIVISIGIAEIRMPWMASTEHILEPWIRALPAGKTLLLKHL
jgi:hypothetical protein